MMDCDNCNNFVWDEDAQEYYCTADLDDDDVARLMQEDGRRSQCPFWESDNEYEVVRHQAF